MATIWSVDELVEASAVNPIEEIDKKYYEYGPGFGYYILSNVYKNFDKFREVVRSCPVYPNIMSKLNPHYLRRSGTPQFLPILIIIITHLLLQLKHKHGHIVIVLKVVVEF